MIKELPYKTIKEMEINHIKEVLKPLLITDKQAAKILGITPTTLKARIKKYEIR